MHARRILNSIKNSEEPEDVDVDRITDTSNSPLFDKEFSWKTAKKPFSELTQVQDDYVVHARGFTVDTDVWLDEYAVLGGHKMAWKQVIGKIYDKPYEYYLPDNMLYWSVTGSSTFVLQHPTYYNAPDGTAQYLKDFLLEFEVPEDSRVSWNINRESSVSFDAKKLYDEPEASTLPD